MTIAYRDTAHDASRAIPRVTLPKPRQDVAPVGDAYYLTVLEYLRLPEKMEALLVRWLKDRPDAIPGAIATSQRPGRGDLAFDAFFLDPERAAPIRARLLREIAAGMRRQRHAAIDNTKRHWQDRDEPEHTAAKLQADAEVEAWLAAALEKTPVWEFDEGQWRDQSSERKPPWIDREFGVRVPGERDVIHLWIGVGEATAAAVDGVLTMGDPRGCILVTDGALPASDAEELKARGVIWLGLGEEFRRFAAVPMAEAEEEV